MKSEIELITSRYKKTKFWHLTGLITFKTPPCDLHIKIVYDDKTELEFPIPFTLRGKLDYIIKSRRNIVKAFINTNSDVEIKFCQLKRVTPLYAYFKIYYRNMSVFINNNEANLDLKFRLGLNFWRAILRPYLVYKEISMERVKRFCHPLNSNDWIESHRKLIAKLAKKISLLRKVKFFKFFKKKPCFTIVISGCKKDNHMKKKLELNYKNFKVIYLNALEKLQEHLFGDYFIFLSSDDCLDPYALDILAYFIQKQNEPSIVYFDSAEYDEKNDEWNILLRPDLNKEYLHNYNYIKNSFTIKTSSLTETIRHLCCENTKLNNFYDFLYQILLFRTKDLSPKDCLHIPLILLYSKKNECSGNDKLSITPKWTFVKKSITYEPLISIIIPTKDRVDLLSKCLNTIFDKTAYGNYEVVLVDNNSVEKETFDFYKTLESIAKFRLIMDNGDFNFSRLINKGVSESLGEYICFLNNDTEIITPNWLEEMLYYAIDPNVGIVGAKLLYPDGRIQHAGVIVGLHGLADHAFKGCREDEDYMYRINTPQEYLAVTAACMMTKKRVFKEVGGFDEKLKVNFQDLDYCLKVFEKGYKIIYTPLAVLIHHEHGSRGKPDTDEKIKNLEFEKKIIKKRWKKYILKDPFYNPNLSIYSTRFCLASPYSLLWKFQK